MFGKGYERESDKKGLGRDRSVVMRDMGGNKAVMVRGVVGIGELR